MIREILSEKKMISLLKKKPPEEIFPPASDRAAWKRVRKGSLRKDRVSMIEKTAEYLLKKSETSDIYSIIHADAAFGYILTGDRVVFEEPYFQKRNTFSILVLAECLEYKGRFLPLILEGLWRIISEPYWFLSAHGTYDPNDPIPRHDHIRPDLFSCETGMMLATALSLLGKEISAFSPNFSVWIGDLVDERIFKNVEKKNEFWLEGRNNWSPWCSSNVAAAAVFFLKNDPVRLAKILSILIDTCDRFYNFYAPDGGCDEGPAYYQVAGLKLMNFIEILNSVFGNVYDKVFEEKKMRNIAEYFLHVSIAGNWFASMSDSNAWIGTFHRGLLCRFAERVHSQKMRDFVLNMKEILPDSPDNIVSMFMCHQLFEMTSGFFWIPAEAPKMNAGRPVFSSLPDLQFFVMRECPENENKGAILCIKGGHNKENHNHNDVGEFELFYDGAPLLIDLGSSSYTRFTFSDRRYESWVHSAVGHNIPEVNGILQPPGEEFHAQILEARPGKVVLDLTQAYPEKARIVSFVRTASLNEKVCSVADEIKFSGKKSIPVKLNLYSAVKPVGGKNGVRLGKLKMNFEGIELDSIEKIPITDVRLASSWGKAVYRIAFSGNYRQTASWRWTFGK